MLKKISKGRNGRTWISDGNEDHTTNLVKQRTW